MWTLLPSLSPNQINDRVLMGSSEELSAKTRAGCARWTAEDGCPHINLAAYPANCFRISFPSFCASPKNF